MEICKICADTGSCVIEYMGGPLRIACECQEGKVYAKKRSEKIVIDISHLAFRALNQKRTTTERLEAARGLQQLSDRILGIVREEYQSGNS